VGVSLPVVFHRAARAELNEAAAWYERRRPDLGLELIGEVDHCVDLIGEQPDLGTPVYKDVRRMTLRRFPYSLYYRRESKRVVVLSVFHGKRDPTIWRRRAF
jgi:plasmid stabilization system protein ParE